MSKQIKDTTGTGYVGGDTGAPQPAALQYSLGSMSADTGEWHSVAMNVMQAILQRFKGRGITEKDGVFYRWGIAFARQRQGVFFIRMPLNDEGEPMSVLSLSQEQIFENIDAVVARARKEQGKDPVKPAAGEAIEVEDDGKVTLPLDQFGLPPSPQ